MSPKGGLELNLGRLHDYYEDMMRRKYWEGLFAGVGITCMAVAIIYYTIPFFNSLVKVEDGYADPIKIELTRTDSDQNQQYETILQYQGSDYAVLDVSGELVLQRQDP